MKINRVQLSFKKVQIEITTDCNLKCFNCDRFCRQAPSKEQMSVEQIRKFIKNITDQKYVWDKIDILGGEPTIHPDFKNIIDLFSEYQYKHTGTEVTLITNGYKRDPVELYKSLPRNIKINNTNKSSPINYFESICVAPIDYELYKDVDYTMGCPNTYMCGITLSRYGFYCCGVAAGIDRVIGFNVGLKDLKQVTEESIRYQLGIFCKYCGRFKNNFSEIVSPTRTLVKEELFSTFWEDAFEKYSKQKPTLTLY